MKIRAFAFFIAFSFLFAAHGQSVKIFLNSQVPFQGKFQGFSTVDIFEECPPSSDTCMNWLAALKPNVIRFPSGGQAKFTHLTTGPGYGFNIDEIEEYFFNLFNCDDEDCGAGSNYEAAVNDWMLKCLAQDSLPEGQRYIDDFILMIQNLEAQLGYTIDVLFCLNIVTANAAENKAALDLLVSNGIQVTGVEMGNETYGQSSGFNSFNSYLTYIQNADGLLGDQDYIGMVRQYFPEMKIGVCAAPIATIDIEQGPGITYFINPEIKRIKYDDWNIALGNTWDSSRLISSPVPYTAPLFDAAIVHFYYTSDFWSDCSVQFLEDYDTYGAACCPYTFDTPDLRLGIHSGSLVAGVIGEKKFAYDVWGDTVNTASRMESSGTPGKINISGATYALVKDFFDCEFRGKVNAKNKGEIDMYYVNGLKMEYSKEGDKKTPNGTFWKEVYGR